MVSKRFLILSCVLCLAGFELVQALELHHSVISSGGARTVIGGATLNGTLGSSVSGRVIAATRAHGIGFWYVLRNHVATDVAEQLEARQVRNQEDQAQSDGTQEEFPRQAAASCFRS